MADNKHRGDTLDSVLEEQGDLAGFQARAIKEVIAWQLAEAMKERKLSKSRLATMMHTSRTQVDRDATTRRGRGRPACAARAGLNDPAEAQAKGSA